MTFSDYLGIATIIIASAALIMTQWQIRAAIKHNRLTHRPHLNCLSVFKSDKGSYSLHVENNGLGPAVIHNFNILLNDVKVEGEGDEMWKNLLHILLNGLAYESSRTFLAPGHMISAGASIKVLELKFDENSLPKKEAIESAFAKADLSICYTSIYEEEFMLTTEDNLF